MQQSLPARDLVLVGAGHTNMHVVRMWRMRPIPGTQLTLITPFGRATYSGMLPGTLAGLYRPEEMEIDLYRFTAGTGVRLIVAEATGLDTDARRIELADRPPVRFDVASIGLGSIPSEGRIWQNNERVLSIKPMATFLRRFEERVEAISREKPSGSPIQIAVIGAGAAGVEITFCLGALLHRRGVRAQLMLVDSSDEVLPGYLPKTRTLARRELERRGIELRLATRVADVTDGRIRFTEGDEAAADLVLWATGAAPPPVLKDFHLPKSDDGFLSIRPTLLTTGDAPVFVVGDTATFAEHPLPKAGVYAVREGPVLWENLQRFFGGAPLKEYDPQSGFLSLLATGDGRAIAQYKGWAFHSRWAWKWKDYIDRKFMRMYQDYRPMSAKMERGGSSASASGVPVMRCKGCGGKVGANVLAAALKRLRTAEHADVLEGLDAPEDAAVLTASAAVDVVSVDFFQAFLDDPYVVGRVAALNAMSDLWAMGCRPTAAMAMVTLPEGPPRQQTELMYQLLAGGVRELKAAEAKLLGGHTTEGDELTIGYTVLGLSDGRQPWRKAGLQPGDRLVLTKPLGTGTLLAGLMQAATRAEWMDRLLAGMLRSNAHAAAAAREFDVHAVTDVTGFGLAGHLFEMLDASRVGARMRLGQLPLLGGFRELSRAGVRSSLDPANRTLAERIAVDSGDSGAIQQSPEFHALFDPQTSGGLLIAVRPELADVLVAHLHSAGDTAAAVIGEVCACDGVPALTVVP